MKSSILSASLRKQKLLIEIIAALLLLFFAHTAIDNFLNRLSLRNLFRILPFTYNKADFLSWFIPIIKTFTVALLFFPRTRLLGISISFIVAAIFTVYLIYTPKWPHEFGGILNYLNYTQHLFLICSLCVLSLFAFILCIGKIKKEDKIEHPPVIFT
jgi:hypothetical protein